MLESYSRSEGSWNNFTAILKLIICSPYIAQDSGVCMCVCVCRVLYLVHDAVYVECICAVAIALSRDPSTRHWELGRVQKNMDGQIYGWTGKKMKEQKKSSQTIDIVSYALKVSVNGVICVFVAHFRSSGTSESS